LKPQKSILPYNGNVYYLPQFLSPIESATFYKELLENSTWEQGEIILFGKNIKEPRLKAFYNESSLSYTYSGKALKSTPYNPIISNIQQRLNKISVTYNCCLANLYRDGKDYMGYHSDNEAALKVNPSIASLSLGASRKMLFKHKKTDERIELILHSGDLVLMTDWETQQYWKHSIPKTKKVLKPRINLSFRTL